MKAAPSVRPGPWRMAIVEDHLLQRRRTEELIAAQRGFEVVASTEDLASFMDWYGTVGPAERPHLLTLDLVVDRGTDADPALVAELVDDDVQVLILSAMASPPQVREMLRAGVAGVVGKRDDEAAIVSALWSVIGRRRWVTPELAAVIAGDEHRPSLSDQEERALVLYASGLTLVEVAEAIGVRPDTAKTYLARVKRKYAEVGRPVRSKVELSRAATIDGLIDLSEP